MQKPRTARQNTNMPTPKWRRVVMVVDESPDHRQMLGAHLSHSDYEVVEAASAADALEL